MAAARSKAPREFVVMDRAAIGLGAAFLHLTAEMNFYQVFNEAIEDFTLENRRPREAFAACRAPLPR